MEAPRIEWSAAEVRHGALAVEIAGDRPRGWKSTFNQTVRLLGGGKWGDISLKGSKLKVADVPEGTEDELRFFLDGVVQQANATHVEVEDETGDEAESEGDDGPGDSEDDADARMTARFRDTGADADRGAG